MAQDLPKIVAAVAAKISHRPFESEIPKVAGGDGQNWWFLCEKMGGKKQCCGGSNILVVYTTCLTPILGKLILFMVDHHFPNSNTIIWGGCTPFCKHAHIPL